jgi:hypothetical protein
MQLSELAVCIVTNVQPILYIVMVLSYNRALSWTCIPEYKLIFLKKKKKNALHEW